MRLLHTTITNFKGIDKLELEFKPGFNLLKGENGKRKTSVLEAIAVGLGGFLAGIDGVSTRHIAKNEIRRVYLPSGDGAYSVKHMLPTQVDMEVEISDGHDWSKQGWTRTRTSLQASRTAMQPRLIARFAEAMSNQPEVPLPLICYHGTGRVWSQKREKQENVFRGKYLRTVGYKDALIESSNTKLLLNWCVRMEQIAFQKERKIAEYESVKDAVAAFMSRMNDGKSYQVFYDKQADDLMVEEQGAMLPISDLSAGYQSLIWMVFDIAYRMALLNPFLRERITETSGVVLIDELDMHLHPKWQWKVISSLQQTFPNIQFIAATHAPILFASAPKIWLIDLQGEVPEYCWSHYGLDINTAANLYQRTNEMAAEVKAVVDDFYVSMDSEDYDAAKAKLDELATLTSDLPRIAEMRTMYDLETNWPEEEKDAVNSQGE